MSTTIIGFPRLGEFRELKFTTEKYFRHEISAEELLAAAKELRAKHWNIVKEKGISEIPSNDFSHYDNVLDAAFLFNVVPSSVQGLELTDLERYFALARGYQGEKGDVRALPMKKWFNTNYHYIVPKFEKETQVKLAGHKIFDEFAEAKELGLVTRPVVVGPFTLLQVSDFEDGVAAADFVDALAAAYQEVFAKLAELGAERIQLDEPSLVKDLSAEEKALFLDLYKKLLADKKGLEVLVEVSRFWADRVHFSKRNGKYMIHGVTGPNEYENNINNNWYTNTLAAWVLDYTREALAKYSRPDLNVSAAELEKWADISANMYRPHDEELGVFVQHDGFLDKDIRPVSALSPDDLPLNQKWSWDKILRSPFIKQADVLQGIYFFGDRFNMDEKRRNFDFYEPMTVHESSLSPCIHAILATELGKEEKAVEMYQRTARLDLDNYNNDTEDGLHITSMTGSWLAIVQGFAQMKTWGGKLSFAPFLPSAWTGYVFHINYRGRLIKVAVGKENVVFTLIKGEPLELQVYGKDITLNGSHTVALEK